MSPPPPASSLLLRAIGSTEINSVPLIYDCPRDWNVNKTIHDFDIWYIKKGRGEIEIHNGNQVRHVDLIPGLVCFFIPGDKIRGSQYDPMTVYFVHFKCDPGDQPALAGCFKKQRLFKVQDFFNFDRLFQSLVRVHFYQHPLGKAQSSKILQALILQLLYESREVHRGKDQRKLSNLIAKILKDPGKDWSTRIISQALNVSPATANSCFRRYLGKSVNQFVIESRMDRAVFLLRMSDLTQEKIAFSLGYQDAQYFNRQFSKRMGMTPGEFRKKGL